MSLDAFFGTTCTSTRHVTSARICVTGASFGTSACKHTCTRAMLKLWHRPNSAAPLKSHVDHGFIPEQHEPLTHTNEGQLAHVISLDCYEFVVDKNAGLRRRAIRDDAVDECAVLVSLRLSSLSRTLRAAGSFEGIMKLHAQGVSAIAVDGQFDLYTIRLRMSLGSMPLL